MHNTNSALLDQHLRKALNHASSIQIWITLICLLTQQESNVTIPRQGVKTEISMSSNKPTLKCISTPVPLLYPNNKCLCHNIQDFGGTATHSSFEQSRSANSTESNIKCARSSAQQQNNGIKEFRLAQRARMICCGGRGWIKFLHCLGLIIFHPKNKTRLRIVRRISRVHPPCQSNRQSSDNECLHFTCHIYHAWRLILNPHTNRPTWKWPLRGYIVID